MQPVVHPVILLWEGGNRGLPSVVKQGRGPRWAGWEPQTASLSVPTGRDESKGELLPLCGECSRLLADTGPCGARSPASRQEPVALPGVLAVQLTSFPSGCLATDQLCPGGEHRQAQLSFPSWAVPEPALWPACRV